MGKSRSATVVIAYLMHKYHISPVEGLEQLRLARPLCEPNEGFMKQLEVYHRMNMSDNIDESPEYQRWLYQREVELSRACGQAPEADKIRFEDEHIKEAQAELELRCRKCRYALSPLAIGSGPKLAVARAADPRRAWSRDPWPLTSAALHRPPSFSVS